jgi:hypothetical protein
MPIITAHSAEGSTHPSVHSDLAGFLFGEAETRRPMEHLIPERETMKPWGYVVLALAAFGILVNMKDIKRYIRISTM